MAVDQSSLDRNLVFPRLVERRAREQGHQPFATMVDGETLTYRDAHKRGLAWASALASRGVGHGDRVAVMLPVSLDALTIWLGIAWLGAWTVPVNNEYRQQMLRNIINDSESRIAVVSGQYVDRFVEIAPDIPNLQSVITIDCDVTLAGLDPEVDVYRGEDLVKDASNADFEGPEVWDIAAVMYTSGTTGPSKGALVAWAQILSNLSIDLFNELGPDDRIYDPLPMFHLSGLSLVYAAALVGTQVVLRERFSLTQFWQDISDHGCTTTWLVGGMAALLCDQPEKIDDAETPLRNVLSAPLLTNYREFQKRFGLRICTSFGMTEVSIPLVSDWDPPTNHTCGRVRPGYEVRIVDDHDLPVGPGEFGEIIIRSDTPWTISPGYFGRPQSTADSWRNGWFHTGDGGTYDEDGNFYFVDRIKDAIRRRGENISSAEVEREVHAFAPVGECAAIGVPSLYGEQEVMIYVVAVEGQQVEPAELLDFLVPRMPKFMLPKYIQVVPSLPKTPTLKLRKAELRERFDVAAAWDRDAVLDVIRP
jgi:carnitine-CoA ligase